VRSNVLRTTVYALRDALCIATAQYALKVVDLRI
jgi:hypothetical protein